MKAVFSLYKQVLNFTCGDLTGGVRNGNACIGRVLPIDRNTFGMHGYPQGKIHKVIIELLHLHGVSRKLSF